MSLATEIKAARKAEGLTIAEAAKLIGVTAKTISNWEDEGRNGSIPNAEFFMKMVITYRVQGKRLVDYYVKEFESDEKIELEVGVYRARKGSGELAEGEDMEGAHKKLNAEYLKAKEDRLKAELDEIEYKQKRRTNSDSNKKRAAGSGTSS